MTPRRDYTEADARDALHHCDPAQDRRQWVRLMAAAKDAGLSFDDVLTWSASAVNFKSERDVLTAWRGIRADGAVKAGTLYHEARAAGWKPAAAGESRPCRPAPVVRVVAPEPERRQHETLSRAGRRLWASSLPLAGTVGASYLLARGCTLPPEDGDMRFLPAHRHPLGEYVGPALVALVTDIESREPISLHFTWVCPDGTKANTPGPARLLLGGHRKAGGCIRLWPDEAVTTGLGVGEGIESCLSLAHAFTPVWSLVDAGNLAALPVLPGIEALSIAQDNDPAGRRAAQALADRYTAAGCTVAIVGAEHDGEDLNDIILKDAS